MAIPPNIQARLAQLKAEAAVRAEMERRRQLAQQNAEKTAGQPVRLPTDKKAKGGSMTWQEFKKHLHSQNLKDSFGPVENQEKSMWASAAERWKLKTVDPRTFEPVSHKASNHPVIIAPDGDVLDGRNRIAHAINHGHKAVNAWVGDNNPDITKANGGDVLPREQRDANLANFLQDSQIKQRLYRGQRRVPKTDKFITTQDRSTPSFTDDPEVANVYSQQFGWDIKHGPGSTSVPVYVQMKKPFDIRNLGEHVTLEEFINEMDHDLSVPHHKSKLGYEDLSNILGTLDHHVMKGGAKHRIDATDKRGHFRIRSFQQLADEVSEAGRKKDIDRILDELLPEASVDAYALADSHEVVKELKKQGYDGMIHKDVFDAGMPYYKGDPNKIGEGYDADHTIDAFRPFHQEKIKSAIGNRGTYDTTKADITKADGGSVNIGINVATDRKAGRRYADLIVDGHKTLESRNGDSLRPYVGKRVAIVRTGEGPAKAIGEVTIGEPMVVNKKKFRSLEDQHHVPEGSAYDINTPTKHLYSLHDPVRYDEERDVGHGIVSRKVMHKAGGGKVEEERKKLLQMREELAKKVQEQKAYQEASKNKYTQQLVSFDQWKSMGMPKSYESGNSVQTPSQDVMRLAIGGQGPRNFLKGTVEKVVKPLMPWGPRHRDEALMLGGEWEKQKDDPEARRQMAHNHAIGSWVESNLANYIRKQMGSANDPIRKMADQRHAEIESKHAKDLERSQRIADRAQAETDPRRRENLLRQSVQMRNEADQERSTAMDHILHMDPELLGTDVEEAENRRKMLGGKKMATHPAAQAWEDAVDTRFEPSTIEDVKAMPDIYKGMHEPWMDKADPKTKLYELYEPHMLGFDHIVDILKQDLAEGRLNPDQLSKVSIEQAVRRASEYNQERKKTMAETALKATEGMPVHKDYGNGFKWIELKQPEMPTELPEGWQFKGKKGNAYIAHKPDEHAYSGKHVVLAPDMQSLIKNIYLRHPDEPGNPNKKLEEALKYEGDTMGHCVGNYCPDVASGKSRIFSLRDAKNEPHVTIEVRPYEWGLTNHPEFGPRFDQLFNEWKKQNPNQENSIYNEETTKAIKNIEERVKKEIQDKVGYSISQIKGKGNAKPKKDYIPYVQDFVRSGNWSEVNDFRNTDLIHKSELIDSFSPEELDAVGKGEFLTREELDNLMSKPSQSLKGKADGGIIHKATGGSAVMNTPNMAQMRMELLRRGNPIEMQSIGVNEAPDINPKVYMPPNPAQSFQPAPGGVATPSGMPIGGIDTSKQQTGQQLMPQPPQQPPQLGQQAAPQPPQGAQPGQQPPPPTGASSNILSLTPQGQTMSALKPQGMAKGGQPSVEQMKAELAKKKKTKTAPKEVESLDDDDEEEKAPPKRILVKGEGPGGVTGIVIPHHMLHGRSWINKKGNHVVVPGLKDINRARAEVYGAENRDPLSIGQIGKIHKETLAEHFAKPLKEQLAAEKDATKRLRAAKHLGASNNTLDESEKLDTVRHETDEEGRTHVGFASKGVAGHALYTSGYGKNQKHHIINTCPGQTEGCGGGKDAKGVVDTSKGTCFAPNAESQYVHAAVRRATHEQAKHDPAMTRDWILAHTGSMREAAKKADKNNQRLLFRPNVVDETDVSSRHAIRHLNEQRNEEDKPMIIANSYGKTNELHDPENGYYVTHSNVGPKVKHGREVSENIGRDRQRVRNTVMAADNRGDFTNEQGNKTPPKGSYMVTDVKRNSPMSREMEKHITHAKYWSTGREEHELSPDEKAEGHEGNFGGNGKPTTPEKAHYGHTTVNGRRYDYQKQHILHPRLVNVPVRKKNKETGEMETKDHMIPTDSRFKDTEFLPKNRFKTKNGKEAGHILMTTPTESTSNIGHHTPFTHSVSEKNIEHAKSNNGEYEIDNPAEQEKARGKEYVAPQPIKIMKKAGGGAVSGSRHHGFEDDDFHAFPERNVIAQHHLALRRGEDEESPAPKHKKAVVFHNNLDTMRYEMLARKKG